MKDCSSATNNTISEFCRIVGDKSKSQQFNKCLMDCVSTIPFKINPNCFAKLCKNVTVTCGDCGPSNNSGQGVSNTIKCPEGCACKSIDVDLVPPCGFTPCPANGNIYLCSNTTAVYMKSCGCPSGKPPTSLCPDGTGGGGKTFLHEVGHYCGPDCNSHPDKEALLRHQKFVDCMTRCMKQVQK